jgi:hypothetical protein
MVNFPPPHEIESFFNATLLFYKVFSHFWVAIISEQMVGLRWNKYQTKGLKKNKYMYVYINMLFLMSRWLQKPV